MKFGAFACVLNRKGFAYVGLLWVEARGTALPHFVAGVGGDGDGIDSGRRLGRALEVL